MTQLRRKRVEAKGVEPGEVPVEALIARAQHHFSEGQWEDAEACLQQAMHAKPGDPTCLVNLAQIRLQAGAPAAAAEILEELAKRPANDALRQALGIAHRKRGETERGLQELRGTLSLDSPWPQRAIYLGFLRSGPGINAVAVLEETRRLLPPEWQTWMDPRSLFPRGEDPRRKLRVGYLGGLFHRHAAARWLEGILRAQDRTAFEVCCFAQVERPDEVTGRFKLLADVWVDTLPLNDEALCSRIREEKVDVLVDLSGLWPEGRPGVLARRAAPIQVALTLDYEGTRGLPNIDARLSDEVNDPPGELDAASVEPILRSGGPKSVILPPPESPEVAPLPFLQGNPFTFGCLCSPERIHPAVVDVLATLLRRAPESRLALLLLHEGDQAYRNYRLAQFAHRGVRPDRILFWPRADPARYLRYFHGIDLGLAPFPVVGGTTTFDALWMGVPVVVLDDPGAMRHFSRNFLRRAGLEEWCASFPEAYVQWALAWMNRPQELGALRSTLRSRLLASDLCDAEAVTRRIETCLRELWVDWCEGRRTESSQSAHPPASADSLP